jgi:hypothetical protein
MSFANFLAEYRARTKIDPRSPYGFLSMAAMAGSKSHRSD